MNRQIEATLDKQTLRRAMLLQLEEMHADERVARSEKICARIVDCEAWQNAKRVLLFSSLRTEPQITALQTASIAAGRETFVIPPTLRIESELELPFTPDLVLVPGLAFSRTHQRLGRGGGCYDRLLAGRASPAYKLGVCFSIQLREAIPTDAHDVVLNDVITD
ncbi:MAG: 5-formyltetrahydrofolate cyclo-ligase [Chthoniobacterales bacterium]